MTCKPDSRFLLQIFVKFLQHAIAAITIATKSSNETQCLHTPHRSKSTGASRFPCITMAFLFTLLFVRFCSKFRARCAVCIQLSDTYLMRVQVTEVLPQFQFPYFPTLQDRAGFSTPAFRNICPQCTWVFCVMLIPMASGCVSDALLNPVRNIQQALLEKMQ